jgi:hypothetical protein
MKFPTGAEPFRAAGAGERLAEQRARFALCNLRAKHPQTIHKVNDFGQFPHF